MFEWMKKRQNIDSFLEKKLKKQQDYQIIFFFNQDTYQLLKLGCNFSYLILHENIFFDLKAK